MERIQAIKLGIEALENILYYAGEGLIWSGDGSEETERETQNNIKAYQQAIDILKTIKLGETI